jgi:hypothetical protein
MSLRAGCSDCQVLAVATARAAWSRHGTASPEGTGYGRRSKLIGLVARRHRRGPSYDH